MKMVERVLSKVLLAVLDTILDMESWILRDLMVRKLVVKFRRVQVFYFF